MARKELSTEEVVELCSSPYVDSVKAGKVVFTPEFKRILYDELANGKMLRKVLKEHGINPEILGDKRIYRLAERLRKYGKREGGFTDLRKNNGHPHDKEAKEQTLAVQVDKLQHELAYTRQEIEFLKKIRMADLEAQKLWESKQRRK